LFVSVSPEVGSAPLLVTFSAVPSGGVEPYTYAWDFTSDGVVDSNKAQDQYPFLDSATLSVTVTDDAGKTVSTSRSITIIDNAPPTGEDPLEVKFNASPLQGNVPFNVQFTSYVDGGKPPYTYSWDFNGDGVFDSFLENPLYTYESIGAKVDDRYVFYPVLQVEDSRGVVKTNLDDDDNNGVPDFKIQINAAPPETGLTVNASANPLSGQAPLYVEFTGSVLGGSGDYSFTWDFGDEVISDPVKTSIVTHTYVQPGVYQARVTVLDVKTSEEKTSAPLTIDAAPEQTFTLDIGSDIKSGQVPFVVNFEAMPVNGSEPIQYQWDVFTDTTPLEEKPSTGEHPSLASAAVVTPDFSYRMNPSIHFGNTAGTGAPYSYVVRCVATDKNGNTAVSENLIRVVASPNTTYPFYECIRPMVVGGTIFPVFTGAGESADAIYQPYPMPIPWAPRANPAVCAHPTGISFVIGGEHLDENGNFESLVNRGDSMYMFVPATNGTGTGEGQIGKFSTGAAGYIVALNDDTGPAFPGSPQTPFSPQWKTDLDAGDTCVPVQLDPEEDPASPPPSTSLRSAPFTIVGSAAAIYMHERPETNPAGAYPGPSFWATAIPPIVIDRDLQGFPEPKLWPWPDQGCHGWGCDAGG
jgi:PKD repeat protein